MTDKLKQKLTFEQIINQNFWQNLSKEMHVVDKDYMNNFPIFNINDNQKTHLKNLMLNEGYFQLTPPQWDLPIDQMANTIKLFHNKDIMPIFSFIFDEFWLLFYKLDQFYKTLLNDNYKMLPDFWVWLVDPKNDESGWRPHRDKGLYALFPDGSPLSLTTWIPLTNATPLNGCMYIVPKHLDHGGEKDGKYGFDLSSIRALPAPAGSIFMWNQCVYHWGSKTSRLADEPRISVAFEFQRGDVAPFNQFLLSPMINYTFNQRLILIGKQILQYTHMYPLAKEYENIAIALTKLNSEEKV